MAGNREWRQQEEDFSDSDEGSNSDSNYDVEYSQSYTTYTSSYEESCYYTYYESNNTNESVEEAVEEETTEEETTAEEPLEEAVEEPLEEEEEEEPFEEEEPLEEEEEPFEEEPLEEEEPFEEELIGEEAIGEEAIEEESDYSDDESPLPSSTESDMLFYGPPRRSGSRHLMLGILFRKRTPLPEVKPTTTANSSEQPKEKKYVEAIYENSVYDTASTATVSGGSTLDAVDSSIFSTTTNTFSFSTRVPPKLCRGSSYTHSSAFAARMRAPYAQSNVIGKVTDLRRTRRTIIASKLRRFSGPMFPPILTPVTGQYQAMLAFNKEEAEVLSKLDPPPHCILYPWDVAKWERKMRQLYLQDD